MKEDPRKTADLRNTDRNIPYSETFQQKDYPLYEPKLGWLYVVLFCCAVLVSPAVLGWLAWLLLRGLLP